jgi:hypothetical protein
MRKIVIKYNLNEYFGIDIQMKLIDLEFFIQSIQLDSLELSPLFIIQFETWNSKIPSKVDYKQNIITIGVRFIGVCLKCNALDVVTIWILFVG